MDYLFQLVGKVVCDNQEANEALEETTNQADKSSTSIVESFKKIAVAVATSMAVKKIVDFGKACVETAATVRASTSKYEQTFKEYADEATSIIAEIAESTSILSTRLNDTAADIYAFAMSNGATSEEALALMQNALTATADAAAYYDKSLESTAETMMSFLKGNYANDAALGVSATEYTRNAKAFELFGKEYNDLTEIQKQQTLLKMVTDSQELSGAMGQAAREADGYENVVGNMKEAWKQFMAVLGDPILTAVIPIIQNIQAAIEAATEKVKELQVWAKEHETLLKDIGGIIIALTAAVAGYNAVMLAMEIKTKLATAATWLQAKAQAALNAVMSLNPIGLVVAAIAALVAAFVYLWNTSEGFRNFWIKMWDNIKTTVANFVEKIKPIITVIGTVVSAVWNSIKEKTAAAWEKIKNAITTPIENAKAKVKSIIDTIKGFFNFTWTLPKIKLPHFAISPSGWKIGDLLKGSIPKLAIEWYAKGGILQQPTAFGINPNNNSIMIGGEAGKEAVAPIDTLMGYVRTAVAEQNAALADVLERILEAMADYFPQFANRQLVLDTGVLVGEIAVPLDEKLGTIQRRKER